MNEFQFEENYCNNCEHRMIYVDCQYVCSLSETNNRYRIIDIKYLQHKQLLSIVDVVLRYNYMLHNNDAPSFLKPLHTLLKNCPHKKIINTLVKMRRV